MVLPASDGVSRVPPYSGLVSDFFSFSVTRLLLTLAGLSRSNSPKLFLSFMRRPTTPSSKLNGLGLSRFARRYSGNRFCFLFLRVLRCFSSPGLPPAILYIQITVLVLPTSGLPHSDISGSLLTYSSPEHFGVCPVLLRLLSPRHSPCALNCLTYAYFSKDRLCMLFLLCFRLHI